MDHMYAMFSYLNAFLGPPLRRRNKPVTCKSRKAKWRSRLWTRPVEVVEA